MHLKGQFFHHRPYLVFVGFQVFSQAGLDAMILALLVAADETLFSG